MIGHRSKANALRDYLRQSIREFCDRQRSLLDRWTEFLSTPIVKPLHIRCTRLRQLQLESLEGRSLLTSGVLDFSFGVGGKVLTDIGGSSNQLNDVAMQSDGKIVAVGSSEQSITSTDIAVVRYNPDGSKDPSFGSDGIVLIDFHGRYDYGNAVAIDANGNIFVVGSTQNGFYTDFAIAKLSGTNGALDASFDSDGKLTIDLGTTNDTATDVAIDIDGNLVVVGGTVNDFALIKIDGSTGILDASFSSDGKLLIDFGGYDYPQGVALDSNGNILVVGELFTGGANVADIAIAKVNGSSGALDNSFDGDGKLILNLSSWDNAADVAFDDSGNIFVGGFSDQGILRGRDCGGRSGV